MQDFSPDISCGVEGACVPGPRAATPQAPAAVELSPPLFPSPRPAQPLPWGGSARGDSGSGSPGPGPAAPLPAEAPDAGRQQAATAGDRPPQPALRSPDTYPHHPRARRQESGEGATRPLPPRLRTPKWLNKGNLAPPPPPLRLAGERPGGGAWSAREGGGATGRSPWQQRPRLGPGAAGVMETAAKWPPGHTQPLSPGPRRRPCPGRLPVPAPGGRPGLRWKRRHARP